MAMNEREMFFRHLGLPSANPLGLEITGAERIFLTGKDGQKYIDLVSGISVSNLGHGHPAIKKAIKDQVDQYLHLMVYGKYIQSPQVRFVRLLAGQLPESLQTTFLVNSGSEAIEGALKLAKRYTGKHKIISFKNAYHGGTHGALSILGNERLKQAFRPLLPEVYHAEFNNNDGLDIIDEQTACVVIEPIQAEAGIIEADMCFLQALKQKCTEKGCLLIFDEIQTGFGRTGRLFAWQHYGIPPDILCLAKGMGGGMPIGAFVSSVEIMKSLTFEPELGHITTFGGHPVSSAAALANLETILDDNLLKNAKDKGVCIKSSIASHPLVKEVRGKGLFMGVDLGDKDICRQVYLNLLANQIIVDQFLFNQNAFRIAPPLIINEQETKLICSGILQCLDNVQQNS